MSLNLGTEVFLPRDTSQTNYYPPKNGSYAINVKCVYGKARTWGQFDGSVRSSTTNGVPDL